jgi:hypothetical protein
MNFIIVGIPVLLIIPALYLLVTRRAKGGSDEPRAGVKEPSKLSEAKKPEKLQNS